MQITTRPPFISAYFILKRKKGRKWWDVRLNLCSQQSLLIERKNVLRLDDRRCVRRTLNSPICFVFFCLFVRITIQRHFSHKHDDTWNASYLHKMFFSSVVTWEHLCKNVFKLKHRYQIWAKLQEATAKPPGRWVLHLCKNCSDNFLKWKLKILCYFVRCIFSAGPNVEAEHREFVTVCICTVGLYCMHGAFRSRCELADIGNLTDKQRRSDQSWMNINYVTLHDNKTPSRVRLLKWRHVYTLICVIRLCWTAAIVLCFYNMIDDDI